MRSGYFLAGLALALSVLLAGCSDPRKMPLPDDISKLESIKPQLEKLSEDDRKQLLGYVMRRAIASVFQGVTKDVSTLSASTVGEAIDAQRKFVADQQQREEAEKLAQAEAKVKREAAAKALREMVSVSLDSKSIEVNRGMSGMELGRSLKVVFLFTNKSTKDIAGVKGLIEARDLFGDEISSFQVSNDSTIKASNSGSWTGSRSITYAMGSNKDAKLAELGDDKYTLVWLPQSIIFSDGTKAELPQ